MEQKYTETVTLTFGEAGENHVGMQMIGQVGSVGSGFNLDDLVSIQQKFETDDFIEQFAQTLSFTKLHHRRCSEIQLTTTEYSACQLQ